MSFILGVEASTSPDARVFPCGHSYRLLSGAAKKRWPHSPLCPACWVSRPTALLKATRCERRRGDHYDWFPGVTLRVEASSAQGLVTDPALVEAAEARGREILTALELVDTWPGIDLRELATATRFQAATDLLLALGCRVWVGGKHAGCLAPPHRRGWLEPE